jgi:hypothetical protein
MADIMMPNQMHFYSGSNTSIQVTCPISQTFLFVPSVFMIRVGIGFFEKYSFFQTSHKKQQLK